MSASPFGFSLLPFIRCRLRQTLSPLWSAPEGRPRIRTPTREVFDAILSCAYADVGGHRLRRNRTHGNPHAGGSAAGDRSRQRQGSLCPERRPSVVSRLRHQAHDRLCDAARRQGGPPQPRNAAYGFAERDGAVAVKMGFAVGTVVTVDNALKMLMVKSANDMAVVLAEGVAGSIENFADEMNANARRLGMIQSSFVNPNGLPADDQISSARDLAILARALIRELPEYDYYWHLPGIRMGKMVRWNYNTLIGRYPGADGMKTGFICASGFNLVASATRNGRRLVAVVLGAPSSAARALKAAQLLERGFNTSSGLTWL